MKRWLVLAMLALGCDEPIGPDPTGTTGTGGSTANAGGAGGDGATGGGGSTQGLGYENGERLKVQVMAGADGSKVPWGGLVDTELDAECTFRKASDGQTRCLPIADTASYYADDACTVPLLHVTCPPKSHARVYQTAPSCGTPGERIFPVGAEATNVTIYENTGGPCSAVPVPGSGQLYQLGAEMGPGMFVAGTQQTEP